jgi:hypothetical protein
MKIRYVVILIYLIVLCSCSNQHAFVKDEFIQNSVAYEIKNRQAMHRFKDMKIGNEFEARKIRRSWTESYHFPFIFRFSGAKEKFSFIFVNSDTLNNKKFKAAVFCKEKIKEKELPDFIPYPFPLKYENNFSGRIINLNDTSDNASFLISEPPYIMFPEHISEGNFTYKNRTFKIKGINSYKKKNGKPGFTGKMVGYEVYDASDKQIMSVSCMNKGMVWIDKNFENDIKPFLMALSSAMMLKRDLKEEHQRTKSGFYVN